MSKLRSKWIPVLGGVLLLLAGWGAHRVVTRIQTIVARVPYAMRQPPPPLDRSFRRVFIWIPPGAHPLGDPASGTPARSVETKGFWSGRNEVTCESFAEFLNETLNETFESPQFLREGGRWQARRPAFPVAHVSLEQARAYTQWFSARNRCRARLPTADEWEVLARGGIDGAPYPWGWGEPRNRAAYAQTNLTRTALYAANGFGVFDAAGGLAEWCEPDDRAPVGLAPALGGSWSERDTERLQPGRRFYLAPDYRDADVGFRLILDPPTPAQPAT